MTLAACAVAIVLLFDISRSVSPDNYAMQVRGTELALRSQSVVRAIEDSPGGVAITVIEWGTKEEQRTTLPWTILRNRGDAESVGVKISSKERPWGSWTALGDAMRSGLNAFDDVPCEPERRVIDVSGDGMSNYGTENPVDVRDAAQEQGVVINGLPIITGLSLYLDDYFRDQVITPGGFVIRADGFSDIGAALERKLVQEIAEQTSGRRFAAR